MVVIIIIIMMTDTPQTLRPSAAFRCVILSSRPPWVVRVGAVVVCILVLQIIELRSD